MSAIRELRSTDRDDWLRLWHGYLDFYATELDPAVSAATWARLLDPQHALFGRVAEVDGRAVGFSIALLHAGSWALEPLCYLEDLFVDPAHRGRGLGRALIDDLLRTGRERGWSTLYWHTRRDNPARRLYDEFVAADDFVRYRIRI